MDLPSAARMVSAFEAAQFLSASSINFEDIFVSASQLKSSHLPFRACFGELFNRPTASLFFIPGTSAFATSTAPKLLVQRSS